MSTSHKDNLGPQFLYADDLLRDGQWIEATLTIAKFVPANSIKGANGQKVEKDAIGFDGTDKLLVLNATNRRLIKIATGSSKPEGWTGKKVTIYPVTINAFGQSEIPCIRIRIGSGQPIPFGVRKFLGHDLTKTHETE